MIHRCLIVLAVVGSIAGVLTAGSASVVAAPSFIMGNDPRNTVPGTNATGILADGDGADWTVAVLKVDLTSGSVYNGSPDSNLPQEAFWPMFPDLEFDTWFGVPGDPANAIAGGAGDLGGGPLNIGGTGVDAISVSWFNTTTTNTGLTRIANFTLTDDAVGSYQIRVLFGDGTELEAGGIIAGGFLSDLPPPYPEPGTLAVLGVSGLGVLRRARAGL